MSARPAFGSHSSRHIDDVCVANGCEATSVLASKTLPLCERHIFVAYRQIGDYLRTIKTNPETKPKPVVPEFDLMTAEPRKPGDNQATTAYVYYARFGDRVKIGCARHVALRGRSCRRRVVHLD